MKRYKNVLINFRLYEPAFNGYMRLKPGYYTHSFYSVRRLVSLKVDKPYILNMNLNDFLEYCYNECDFIEINEIYHYKLLLENERSILCQY